MTIDCQWVSTRLEALFCDRLSADEAGLARNHIEQCMNCREEVAALNAIDPLMKKYFQQEFARAINQTSVPVVTAPRKRDSAQPKFNVGVLGFGTVAAAIVVILMVFLLRTPQTKTTTFAPSDTPQAQSKPAASINQPVPVKGESAATEERTKPSPEQKSTAAGPTDPAKATSWNPPADANAPDFAVTDPAGYSRTLEDYRGRTVLIGVWGSDQPAAIRNFESLYKSYGSNPKLLFAGVSNETHLRPVNTTFPVFYNQGSKLLGTAVGDFVLLDPAGAVRLRGSLVKDFDRLRKQLQAN